MADDLGDVVLTREFEHKEGGRALLIIGKPVPSKEGGDYECPFKFIGLGNEKVRWTSGVDGLQALMLCIQRAKILFEQNQAQ